LPVVLLYSMSFIGPTEALVIALAVLALILGPKKLPELAASIGEARKEFKQSMKDESDTE